MTVTNFNRTVTRSSIMLPGNKGSLPPLTIPSKSCPVIPLTNIPHRPGVITSVQVPPSAGEMLVGQPTNNDEKIIGITQRFRAGYSDTIGFRDSMEDSLIIVGSFRNRPDEDYYALFDGHSGDTASKFCAKKLHTFLEARMNERNEPKEALLQAFTDCHDAMKELNITSGTTCVVAYFIGDQLYIANCGDSRAILSQRKTAQTITIDHKPDCETEKKRIESIPGGYIYKNRVQGKLAVSRSLGDYSLSPYVSHIPDIFGPFNWRDNYDLIVLACDGLWDVTSADDAIKVSLCAKSPKEAALKLRNDAYDNRSRDNISVVVVWFPDFVPIVVKPQSTEESYTNTESEEDSQEESDEYSEDESEENNTSSPRENNILVTPRKQTTPREGRQSQKQTPRERVSRRNTPRERRSQRSTPREKGSRRNTPRERGSQKNTPTRPQDVNRPIDSPSKFSQRLSSNAPIPIPIPTTPRTINPMSTPPQHKRSPVAASSPTTPRTIYPPTSPRPTKIFVASDTSPKASQSQNRQWVPSINMSFNSKPTATALVSPRAVIRPVNHHLSSVLGPKRSQSLSLPSTPKGSTPKWKQALIEREQKERARLEAEKMTKLHEIRKIAHRASLSGNPSASAQALAHSLPLNLPVNN